MITWLILAPLSLVVSFFCYLTNPIVVLFCDEDGELPGFLQLWQTHDNSCNPSDVTENKQLPDWLLYDWKGHYEEYKGTTPTLAEEGRDRWFTRCINHNWTLTERLKRYICRVYWLMRNCAYGWCFWVFGIIGGTKWTFVQNDPDTSFVHQDCVCWWIDSAWRYKSTAPWFSIGDYTIYKELHLGWKVKTEAIVDTRAMIATRATIRIERKEK